MLKLYLVELAFIKLAVSSGLNVAEMDCGGDVGALLSCVL